MSNTLYAFIDRARIPNRSDLQLSVNALGFNLVIDEYYEPFENSGFLPFLLDGRKGMGFEIFYEDAAELIDQDDTLRAISAGRDYCISMSWGGSMADCACAMIICCALTKDFDASVSYEGDRPNTLAEMLAETQDAVIEAANESRTQTHGHSNPDISIKKSAWWKIWKS